jgi:hypothetical protein
MKKPWSICIVTFILFLVCNVAGATDKKSPARHKIQANAKKIAKPVALVMNYSKAAKRDNYSTRNGMPQARKDGNKDAKDMSRFSSKDHGQNNARNNYQRDSHNGRNDAMGKSHARDRDHDRKIAYNDT